ncbi:hypothetical protein [Pedobacter insulae]|nr:hypothetical protein [Pedobacter insulae]
MNHSIWFSVGKINGLIITGLLMILNHYLLFNVLKFSKNGDSANKLFNIDRRTFLYGWRIFVLNLILGIMFPALGHLFFK